MKANFKILARIVFFVYLAVVLFLCFWNFKDTPDVPKFLLGIPMDKIVHFCMFFPFPVLGFLAYDRHTERVSESLTAVAITFALGILLALLTEFGQSLTTYRSGDIHDFIADLIALALSSLLVLFIDIRKQKTSA